MEEILIRRQYIMHSRISLRGYVHPEIGQISLHLDLKSIAYAHTSNASLIPALCLTVKPYCRIMDLKTLFRVHFRYGYKTISP